MTDYIERVRAAFRLNLEQQKKRAKDLLRAAKAREKDALARIVAAREAGSGAGADGAANTTSATLKLAEAQFVIARELRFASWAKLKAHIAAMDGERTAMAQGQATLDDGIKTLHIRCGHDIQKSLLEAGFAGDFYPVITPYCQGPVTDTPDRHELMARFIVDRFSEPSNPIDYESILDGERRHDGELERTADDYERVVIWMEYDNYDQLALARVLAHYANARRPRVLELVLVEEFPGSERFYGVGQLPPEALRMLWSTRKPITAAQFALGHEAWDALRSPDPRRFAEIARSGTPALRTMAPAFLRQLRELPYVESGMNFMERSILETVAEVGNPMLNRIYWTLLDRDPMFNIGDAGVLGVVRDIERAVEPPLLRTIGTPGEREFANRFTLTQVGRDVLSGTRDWQSLQPPSRWVGGVHVQPGLPGWRWDDRKRDVVWFDR
jgi:hypothetical protein